MNTFPFFPVPASGETAYSLFSRSIARSGLPETYLLQEFTCQRHSTTLLSALPGYLSSISRRMPLGHPWRDATLIVRKHTSLPYFIYFDEKENRDRWVDRLAGIDSSQPITMALGLTSYPRGMLSIHPRYCPTCVQVDRDNYGFPWFRREHLLPGVAVCWRHGTALAQGCSRCGPYPIKGRALSMAGRCLCQEGINPLPVHADLPEDTEPLLWLARQSAWMVNSPGSPFGGIRATLREKVLEKGFGRGSLIEPRRLAKAIEERFGRQTLEWLGTPAWEGERPAAWLRRLLSGQLDGKKRSPALLFLIIIGTLYESLEAFEKTAEDLSRPETIEEELVLPTWSADLFRLLQTGECGLPGISKQLGISTYRLIEKIRQRGWRVPLSHQTRKKLGDAKISAIKEDFMQGMEKTQIMRHHGCSEWALTLIELDEPGLNASFRGAAKLITQERNRARLRDHLSANPTATRIDILEGLPGVYDYMLKQDKEWFYKQISEKKAAAPTPRKSRVDWALLDQNKAIEIAGVFDEMLASGPKPVQATATAALKRAGLLRQYSNDPTKFPLVAGILQERSESRQNFIRRRLAWAVEQMANSGDPISINKLRRVASLPAETMRDHRQEVINLAEQMNTAIDGGSFFA